MEPDNFSVHCDCRFVSVEEARRATRFWSDTVREVLGIVGPEHQEWRCHWSSSGDHETNAVDGVVGDLAGPAPVPELPTRLGADVLLLFEPAGPPVTGRSPRTAGAELDVHSSGTDDAAHELTMTVWLERPWTRSEAAPLEEVLIRRLLAFVDRADCDFACLSDDLHDVLPLESAQRRSPRVARRDSAHVLRNYSWVTYCGPALAARLDLDAAATAGWPRTTRSGRGGTLLQFTAHLEDFAGSSVRTAAAVVADAIDPAPAVFRPRESSARLLWSDGRAGPLPRGTPVVESP